MTIAKVANRVLPVVFTLALVPYVLAIAFFVVFGWLVFGGPRELFWQQPHALAFVAFLISLPGYALLYFVWLNKVGAAKKRGESETAILQWALLPTLGITWTITAISFLGWLWE